MVFLGQCVDLKFFPSQIIYPCNLHPLDAVSRVKDITENPVNRRCLEGLFDRKPPEPPENQQLHCYIIVIDTWKITAIHRQMLILGRPLMRCVLWRWGMRPGWSFKAVSRNAPKLPQIERCFCNGNQWENLRNRIFDMFGLKKSDKMDACGRNPRGVLLF